MLAGTYWSLAPLHSYGESAADLVKKGNVSYRNGNYDAALSAYKDAAATDPDSPHIRFNQGTALYRKDNDKEAQELFSRAASDTDDPKLQARSWYNIGNCEFRNVKRNIDSNPQNAVDSCKSAINSYRNALKLDPEFMPSAQNIEIARLTMKALLAKMEQQQQSSEQQKSGQDAMDKLKELIQKQESALDKNKELAQQRSQQGKDEKTAKQAQNLSDEQKQLQQETQDLASGIKDAVDQNSTNQSQAPQQTDLKKVGSHLRDAVRHQESAGNALHFFLQKNSLYYRVSLPERASIIMRESLKMIETKTHKNDNKKK